MADFDIDSSIAALEKSISSSTPAAAVVSSSIQNLTNSTPVASEPIFSKKLLIKAGISLVLSIVLVALLRPVYLCKLEYDDKDGKCKASLLLIKSTIAVLVSTVVFLAAFVLVPKFM